MKNCNPFRSLLMLVVLFSIFASCAKNSPLHKIVLADTTKVNLPAIDVAFQTEGQTTQSVNPQIGNINQYLAYVPIGYNKTTTKKWPVIIFLHGLGEIGTNINQVKANGLPGHLDTARTFPFLVFSPQCNGGGWWNTSVLEQLLAQVSKKYNCDPSRVYLTGLSMGGIETWSWAIQDPTSFAAIAPVSATGDPSKVSVLKNTPTWVFHGDKDPTVPYSGDLAMVNALKAAGGNVQLYTVIGGQHNIWEQVYNDKDLYSWMLRYKLP